MTMTATAGPLGTDAAAVAEIMAHLDVELGRVAIVLRAALPGVEAES